MEFGRFGCRVAIFLVDGVAVGGVFGVGAARADPAMDLGEHAGVVSCFAFLNFPCVAFGSGAAVGGAAVGGAAVSGADVSGAAGSCAAVSGLAGSGTAVSGAAWECACCGEEGGQEEKL